MSRIQIVLGLSVLALPAFAANCPKLPPSATTAPLRASADADWSRWDPKLAASLKGLWQRSVLAVGQKSHASVGAKETSRRPAAEGPFEAAAWEVDGGNFVTFRVKVVPAGETDNAATRVERFAGFWKAGKLERLESDCLKTMEPSHFDLAARTVYGKPLEGECLTASCPLP